MQFDLDNLPVVLPLGGRINLAKANGVRVRVLDGRIWVTQEGSPDDVFVAAGAEYELVGDGKIVISAEGRADAQIAFDTPLSVTSRNRFSWAALGLIGQRHQLTAFA